MPQYIELICYVCPILFGCIPIFESTDVQISDITTTKSSKDKHNVSCDNIFQRECYPEKFGPFFNKIELVNIGDKCK